MGKSWNRKNSHSQLNNIFQISNRIWHKLSYKCFFFCSNSITKDLYFRLDQLRHMCSPNCVFPDTDCFYSNRSLQQQLQWCDDFRNDSAILCIALFPIHSNMSETWYFWSLCFARTEIKKSPMLCSYGRFCTFLSHEPTFSVPGGDWRQRSTPAAALEPSALWSDSCGASCLAAHSPSKEAWISFQRAKTHKIIYAYGLNCISFSLPLNTNICKILL